MTRPRSALISLEATPYYHCISRCVRRAFLCGKDRKGKDFSHRKQWLVDRIKLLSEVFAINVAAYAVMSNHYHLVLHIDQTKADAWTPDEVITHWCKLYRGPTLLQRKLDGEHLSKAELQALSTLVEIWRSRLCSISWFMSCLNYVIALQANKEDGCTGRFWEGRFKSQALKDEAALVACLAYVDLNPVRAGIANDLPGSDYTSIQDRIKQIRTKGKVDLRKPQLMDFAENEHQKTQLAKLPYRFSDYLELVDWQGRTYHPTKKGIISPTAPKLLDILKMSEAKWRYLSSEIHKESGTMLSVLLATARTTRWTKVKQVA